MKCPNCGHPDTSHNDAGCFHDDGRPCFCMTSGEEIRFPEQYQHSGAVSVEKILSGAELIAEERQSQILEKRWSAEHDDQWVNRELARAAIAYLLTYVSKYVQKKFMRGLSDVLWPWDLKHWKPTHDIAILKKAGALIAAEIDRLQRRVQEEK